MLKILLFVCIVGLVKGRPSDETKEVPEPSLITYGKDGNVGVNFGGYRASAGLGGLLSGDASQGGLHAEAGTPHGQGARAGLGGIAGQNGNTAGGLYADATAGNGIGAGAGINGAVPPPYENNGPVPINERNGVTPTYVVVQKERYRPGKYRNKHVVLGPVGNVEQPPINSPPPGPDSETVVRYNVRPDKTIDAIFAIPIATLDAVNNLVSGLLRGGSFRKSVHYHNLPPPPPPEAHE